MSPRRSQVTTKRGDHGETTALNGEHYSKSHPIMECTGAVDELRAQTALARLMLLETGEARYAEAAEFLWWLLHVYFLVGTACNDPQKRRPELWHDEIGPNHLERLEAFQAHLEQQVTLPKDFIVSASNIRSAQLDIAATSVRRLERCMARLKEATPEFDVTHLFPFINRLSDVLFVFARYVDGGHFQAVDYTTLR